MHNTMKESPKFHGSDLEQIAEYYHIPKSEIVCFGANVNPLGLSDHVRLELAKNLEVITSYPDREYTSLRRQIGAYCNIDPDYIIVGNGSTELISLFIQHRRPQHALVLGPTYSEYERELHLCGGKISYYHLNADSNFQLPLSDFCNTLTEKYDLLILCNPNNPTSSALHASELRSILEVCQQHNIFVMIDETYIEFAPDMQEYSAVPFIEQYDHLMVLRGVSKFFAAPGLRLGYGMTSNQAFRSVLKECQNPWSLNSIGAFAGELFFQDHEYIRATKQLIHSERERIYNELTDIPGLKVFTPTANFMLVQILKEGITSHDVFDSLIRQKMMVRDCSSFENLNGEFFRFCIMHPEDNTRLLQALKTMFL